MKLGQIIKQYREVNDLSMKEFSKASGLSRAYISILERDYNPKSGMPPVPSIESVRKAAKGMYMSYNDLSSMLVEDNNEDSVTISKKAIQIPVLGNVAAGIPIEAVEDVIGYEEISENLARKGEYFGLKIKGNSMEPEIKNSDIVIVRQQDDAVTGDIVVALVNGDDATCKRLVKYATGIRLMPINPAYEPLFFSSDEVDTKPVKIVGKVVEVRRKY